MAAQGLMVKQLHPGRLRDRDDAGGHGLINGREGARPATGRDGSAA